MTAATSEGPRPGGEGPRPGAAAVARFGARVAGVPLALPLGTALEFVAGATVHPLPLAPARVAGLMQLRGQPLVVFDPARRANETIGVRRCDVLVVGAPPEAALVVDAAPQPLPQGARAALRVPAGCSFAAELEAARTAASTRNTRAADAASTSSTAGTAGTAGTAWLEVEPQRLFEALARG